MKVQEVEKVKALFWSLLLGCIFCRSIFLFKTTAPLRLILSFLFFFFLWKKQLFTEVELLFMCSSQEGIRPHSRKYWTSESCSCLFQTPEERKVQTVFVSSINWTLPKVKQTSEAVGDLASLWQMSENERLSWTNLCMCIYAHLCADWQIQLFTRAWGVSYLRNRVRCIQF